MEIAALTARIHPAGAGIAFSISLAMALRREGGLCEGGSVAFGAELASRPIFTMRAVLPELRVGAYPCFWYFEI